MRGGAGRAGSGTEVEIPSRLSEEIPSGDGGGMLGRPGSGFPERYCKGGKKVLKFYLNGLLVELGGSLENALGKWNSLSRCAVSLEMLAHRRRMRIASIAAENRAHEDTLCVDILVLLSVR